MSKKIKVAIVGVGNCASSLVQGLHYYHSLPDSKIENIGLISPFLINIKLVTSKLLLLLM